MTKGTIRSALETASHIAFIGACIVLVVMAFRDDSTNVEATARHGFVQDLKIDRPDMIPSGSARAVFLGVRSTCRFCTESMGFYRRLAALQGPTTFELVIGSREAPEVTREYLKAYDVTPARIVSVDASVPLPATPALLVLAGDGSVTDSWLGKLSSDQEREVIAIVSGGSR